MEDRFGDVVVATPIRRALRERELIHEMASPLPSDARRNRRNFLVRIDQMYLRTRPEYGIPLGGRRAARNNCNERQPQQIGKIGLGNRRRSGRRFDHGRPFAYVAVANGVKKQGSSQAMLQASGRMRGLIFDVELHAWKFGQFKREQRRIHLLAPILVEFSDGVCDPRAIGVDGDVHAS